MRDTRPASRSARMPLRSAASVAAAFAAIVWLLGADMAAAQTVDQQTSAYRERTEVRLSQLEAQIRQLTGSAERLQFSIERLNDRLDRLVADLDYRLAALEQGGGATGLAGTEPTEPPLVAGATPPPEAERPPAADTGGDQVAAGVLPAGSVMDQYSHAQRLVLQTRYDEAETALREFVARYPDHTLTDNAKYWLAETYYVRRQYQDAAAEFLQAWQDAPDGSKAPDNLLKLALSLAALEKREEACVTLEKLVGDYQLAGEHILNRARQEKSSLRCG